MNLDDNEYSNIIDKYKDLAYTIALKITKNEQDSEEIVQDSFVKAFQGLSKFRNDSQFSTWFYRIVYNTAISATRRGKLQTTNIDEESIEKIEDIDVAEVTKNLNHQDRIFLIRNAMDKLDELGYTILTLFYYESKSLKEIAAITGKKRNYLKVLLQRARRKLYDELNDSTRSELRHLL